MNMNLINYLKDKIINDLKKFDFIEEVIFLEKKHNDLIDKSLIKIICLSNLVGAFMTTIIIKNKEVSFEYNNRKEIEEEECLLEVKEYLDKTYKKNILKFEEMPEFQKKAILSKVKVKKNKEENSKKRL